MIVIEVVLYINSMLTDIHAIKEEEVFVLKKSKNQKRFARAMKKKEIKRIAKRKVRISAIIVVFYYFLK